MAKKADPADPKYLPRMLAEAQQRAAGGDVGKHVPPPAPIPGYMSGADNPPHQRIGEVDAVKHIPPEPPRPSYADIPQGGRFPPRRIREVQIDLPAHPRMAVPGHRSRKKAADEALKGAAALEPAEVSPGGAAAQD